MKIRTVFLCAVVLCTEAAWGGPILETVPVIPSDLNTPTATPGKNYIYTVIGCVSASSGAFVGCGYDFSITGLTASATDPVNNGGHTHTVSGPDPHPLGTLSEIRPTFQQGVPSTQGNPGNILTGNTLNNSVIFQHEIPQASGKIQTVLNLRVPPGWHTISPESCDGSLRYWCFNTTVDVGVNNLTLLPDAPWLYAKTRNQNATAIAHTDAVAFTGTDSALHNLTSIALWYNWIFGRTLSINDMSLIKGGLFDVQSNYSTPHSWHRTGESADINKTENGDCKKNRALLISVYIVMGRAGGQIFAGRSLPSYGHFLCETGQKFKNSNNIHIDL